MTYVLSNFDEDAGEPVHAQCNFDSIWEQFNANFPTERDAVEELFRRLNEQGVSCRHCEGQDILRGHGDRTIKCLNCAETTWLTAGTFFHRVRLVRPWLAAIWFMEHGVIVSSFQFHKLVGIAYASALSIFKKLTMIIQSQMDDDFPAVSSARFKILMCRRSRETPARRHPNAEQEQIEQKSLGFNGADQPRDQPGSNAVCQSSSVCGQEFSGMPDSAPVAQAVTLTEENANDGSQLSDLCDMEKQVYQALSAESIHCDHLCEHTKMPIGEVSAALMMLELKGLAMRLPGDRYIRSVPAPQGPGPVDSESEYNEKLVAACIEFVRFNFQGISRKYLQNYLAWYWCQTNRIRWRCGALLKECLRFRIIKCEEIISYVSPPLVKMAPCSTSCLVVTNE